MPYMAIVRILRQQLADETDRRRRELLEATIAVLLGVIEIQKTLDVIKDHLDTISK